MVYTKTLVKKHFWMASFLNLCAFENVFFFNFYFLLLFKHSFLPFPPLLSIPVPAPHIPTINPHIVGTSEFSIHVPWLAPFPSFPLSALTPLLVTVSLFFISISLVHFCSFVLLIRFHLKVRNIIFTFNRK